MRILVFGESPSEECTVTVGTLFGSIDSRGERSVVVDLIPKPTPPAPAHRCSLLTSPRVGRRRSCDVSNLSLASAPPKSLSTSLTGFAFLSCRPTAGYNTNVTRREPLSAVRIETFVVTAISHAIHANWIYGSAIETDSHKSQMKETAHHSHSLVRQASSHVDYMKHEWIACNVVKKETVKASRRRRYETAYWVAVTTSDCASSINKRLQGKTVKTKRKMNSAL